MAEEELNLFFLESWKSSQNINKSRRSVLQGKSSDT